MHFLSEYGLFLAKISTVVIAILVLVGVIISLTTRGDKSNHKLKIKPYNKQLKDYEETLNETVLGKSELKAYKKAQKKLAKERVDADKLSPRKRLFVIEFVGDIKASEVTGLREMVTAVLTTAKTKDEVVVLLESTGGLVHAYGLAASQMLRIREAGIPLTVCVDKVAASGGYMMACVANRIIAAPFAIIGSIGVIAQLPNFNRLLKKHDIEFEQIMAGEYKRTLSLFGENTSKDREKTQEDVDNIHNIFKHFVAENRPGLQIEQVATGEIWHGIDAKNLQLVDELRTSDDYLTHATNDFDVYQISYEVKRSFINKINPFVQSTIDHVLTRLGINRYA
ncbi:MAG: protease SohB [Pseudomonadota bacterium]|nr:protease SohB [Pseudomonadota bacterium]